MSSVTSFAIEQFASEQRQDLWSTIFKLDPTFMTLLESGNKLIEGGDSMQERSLSICFTSARQASIFADDREVAIITLDDSDMIDSFHIRDATSEKGTIEGEDKKEMTLEFHSQCAQRGKIAVHKDVTPSSTMGESKKRSRDRHSVTKLPESLSTTDLLKQTDVAKKARIQSSTTSPFSAGKDKAEQEAQIIESKIQKVKQVPRSFIHTYYVSVYVAPSSLGKGGKDPISDMTVSDILTFFTGLEVNSLFLCVNDDICVEKERKREQEGKQNEPHQFPLRMYIEFGSVEAASLALKRNNEKFSRNINAASISKVSYDECCFVKTIGVRCYNRIASNLTLVSGSQTKLSSVYASTVSSVLDVMKSAARLQSIEVQAKDKEHDIGTLDLTFISNIFSKSPTALSNRYRRSGSIPSIMTLPAADLVVYPPLDSLGRVVLTRNTATHGSSLTKVVRTRTDLGAANYPFETVYSQLDLALDGEDEGDVDMTSNPDRSQVGQNIFLLQTSMEMIKAAYNIPAIYTTSQPVTVANMFDPLATLHSDGVLLARVLDNIGRLQSFYRRIAFLMRFPPR